LTFLAPYILTTELPPNPGMGQEKAARHD